MRCTGGLVGGSWRGGVCCSPPVILGVMSLTSRDRFAMPKYTHLGGLFWNSDAKVFCEGRPVSLDPKSTRVFFDYWATDGSRVYHNHLHRRVIDASSFVAVNCMYAKDAKQCHFSLLTVSKVLAKADPDTFTALDSGWDRRMFQLGTNHPSGYAKDATSVFFNGNFVRKADATSFMSLQNGYGHDKCSMFCGENQLPRAEPIRWRYLGGGYSRDDNNVYHEHRPVKGAHINRFRQVRPFDQSWAYDGKQFFSQGRPVETADYVAALRREGKSIQEFAAIVENGQWQDTMWRYDRPYREPDESRFADDEVTLGESRKSIDAKLGTGRTLDKAEWLQYFQDFGQTPQQDVVSWSRGRHELICILENGEVVATSIVNRDEPRNAT